jgi:hypothetical protein
MGKYKLGCPNNDMSSKLKSSYFNIKMKNTVKFNIEWVLCDN